MSFRTLFQEAMSNRTRLFIGVILLLIASAAFAQLPTATILGVVKDKSGAVIPSATLTARNTDTGQSRTASSGADGSYRFSALPIGTYEVRAEQAGFQTEVRTGLKLDVSQEAVVNMTLEVGAVEQTIAVTGEAPLVNTTSGSLGGLVNEQKVADLPLNGRNYIDLTLLQTGVTEHRNASKTGNLNGTLFSSNGAPIQSNNFLLDGAIMQGFNGMHTASVSGSTLGVEGIREYRVVTNSFSAEYGMTMGSQMTIVSRGGTGAFHGSIFEYLRNSALDARNFFDYKTSTSSRRLPSFIRNNFGAAGGGPIKKDKTFLFAVYEGVRERIGNTKITNVLAPACQGAAGVTITNAACPQLATTAAATIAPQVAPLLALFPNPNLPGNALTFPFTQPVTENFGQVRVDQIYSTNDSLFARYSITDSAETLPLDYPRFIDDRGSRSQFGTLSETHVFTPALLNTARFSYSRTNSVVNSPSGISGPQYSFVTGQEMGIINIGGVTSLGPAGTAPNAKPVNIFTWSDDLFYTRGRHSWKFGTLINRYRMYFINGTNSKGSITFANFADFLQARPSNYVAASPASVFNRTYNYTTLGYYAQDDVRLFPRLTLNLGLRYEFNTTLQEVRGYGAALRDIQHDAQTTLGPPYKNPSLKNFSPRFGFAWDVQGNGKTALRGGFGLLYDIANYGSALSAGVQATPPFSTFSTVASTTANPLTLALPLTFPKEAAGKALRSVDYNLQQPHMLQYNLTVERQLPYEMAVTLAYGGSRGINIEMIVDGNPTVPVILSDGRLSFPLNAPRTNPNWTSIEWYTGGGNSWYNSLQFGLTKRLNKGLQFQSSYTWSKNIDESQAAVGAENANTADFHVFSTYRTIDRSVSSFDTTHNWRFNTIYHLPGRGDGGAVRALLNGWWMSGILSVQTGYPFTPSLTANRSRSLTNNGAANIDRPNLVPGRNNGNSILGGPDRYFDSSALALQSAGFLGTAGRNIFRGPGFANLDYSLGKDISLRFLGESGKLEFRAEFFNILNHANLGMPNRTVFAGRADGEAPLPTAGKITNTANTSRQIQFALKLIF